MTRFWFVVPLTLEEVGARMGQALGFAEPEYDAENVYEWFEVTAQGGVRLNVSRKHDGGEPDFDEPVHVLADGHSSVDDLGSRLAAGLGATVYFGEVTYLGGDDFRYAPSRRFDPVQRADRSAVVEGPEIRVQYLGDHIHWSAEESVALSIALNVQLDIFRSVVEAQDRGLSVKDSREFVAKTFDVGVDLVRQVERLGLDHCWPPLT